MVDYTQYLDVARAAANAAADIIGRHYAAHLEATDDAAIDLEVKADSTPVTRADKEAEQAIHGIISSAYPSHDFLGEETGRSGSGGEFLWLVDPLDGTRSFVRRYPFFSTQIALMHQGQIVVGVSCAPVFAETAWAVRGGGAWLNERALRVSAVKRWSDCTLSTGNLASLARGAGWSSWVTWWRRWRATAATVIFIITICWQPARSTSSSNPTSTFSTLRRSR